MKEFIEKLIGGLEEIPKLLIRSNGKLHKYISCDEVSNIVNQLAEEYNNGWITDRNPTMEECGEYGHAEFQVTIPQSKGNKTITMDFVYETVRGKEVARWKWCDRLSVWEVLAWKPLDAPYQPKGE